MFQDYELSHLFPHTALDVTIYVRYLQDLYNHDVQNKTATPRLDSLQVQEIIWYKDNTASQHECIVAVVKIPNQDGFRYIRLDRYASRVVTEDGKKKKEKRPGLFSSRSFDSTSSSSLEMLGKDCIRTISQLPCKDTCTRIAGFSPLSSKPSGSVNQGPLKTLRLWDLAILALTIHQHALRYEALKTQCYWYASSLVIVLKRQYDYTEEITKKPPKRAGTWHNIPINTADGEREIECISTKFADNISLFKVGNWQPTLSTGLNDVISVPCREQTPGRPSN